MTPAQLTTLKTDIAADGALNPLSNTPDNADAIAKLYNLAASPDFWVWRTVVTEKEIVEATTVDATVWSWPIFIARNVGERDCWDRLCSSGAINPSLSNVRTAVTDIFSGAPGLAQRTHLLAIARRKATRAEKLYATGTGSTASPATSAFNDGFLLLYTDVQIARAS